jgi:hypothetical protein
MPRRAERALLLLAVVLALAVWLLWFRSDDVGSGGAPAWGRGELRVSERAYYASRIWSVINAARRPEGWTGYPSQDRTDESTRTYLVVDTAKKEMWVESNGQVVQEYRSALPPSMDWKLYRCTPDGMATELPSWSRFRLPVDDMKRLFLPEQVALVGTWGNRESLCFAFSHDDSGQIHRDGRWSPQSLRWSSSPNQVTEDGFYESIIVSDDEYEKARARFSTTDAAPVEPAGLSDNRAAWRRVEKALYQEIERQVLIQGLPLRSVDVTSGPDYTTAAADLQAARSGLWDVLHHGPSSAHVYLRIDYLGNDVWYARSGPHPEQRVLGPIHLDLEFLIPAVGKIAKEDVGTLLAKGRQKQQADAVPSSKWQVTLPNGVSVEFVGICERSNGGRQWWGPDGSPLGFALYLTGEARGSELGEFNAYEIAWRIHATRGQVSGTSGLFEGCVTSRPRQVCDRYGNRLRGDLAVEEYVCDGSRVKTALTIRVRIKDGQTAWASFKNISLVRGENQGFEIIEGEGPE